MSAISIVSVSNLVRVSQPARHNILKGGVLFHNGFRMSVMSTQPREKLAADLVLLELAQGLLAAAIAAILDQQQHP